MSQSTSSTSRKCYGLQRVCRVWGISRSTIYHQKRQKGNLMKPRKRGPRPILCEQEVLSLIQPSSQ